MQEKIYTVVDNEFVYKNRPRVSLFSNVHKLVHSHFSETVKGLKHWAKLYSLTYEEIREALSVCLKGDLKEEYKQWIRKAFEEETFIDDLMF